MARATAWTRGRHVAAVAAGLAATTVGTLLALPAAASAAEVGCQDMTYVAHRGVLTDGTTENTMAAVRKAAALGAGAEIDLRTTVDHRVVLMHDKGIVRTTDGAGLVASMTAAQIREVRTDDGQTVPFARAALTFVRNHPDVDVVLDLKAFTPRSTAVLARIISELGVADQVSAISFSDTLIADFRAANPGIDTFRITRDLPSPTWAAQRGGVNVFGELVTDGWVSSMQQAGVPFNIRVTEDERWWDLAVRTGSSWVMTDDVPAWLGYCPAPA